MGTLKGTGRYTDREHVKGAADKVKGAVKDTAGKVRGDEKMQAEGKMDTCGRRCEGHRTRRDAIAPIRISKHKEAARPGRPFLLRSKGAAQHRFRRVVREPHERAYLSLRAV
jgi:hypothetical protein